MASDDTSDVARKYQRLGGGYDKVSALLDRTAVSRMRAQLVARATGDVLEVAVGTGANLRHYPPGVRLTGLDVAAKALRAASRRAGTLAVEWTPVSGDAARLPLADASVDTVVCTLAGCTFPSPDRAFAEIRRVLRPHGQALFLEHVRSASVAGRVVLRAVTPLTRAALGCHPDRDTVPAIAGAGFTIEVLDRAVGGLFLSIRATPTT
ncbi:class I SAM-dependent methyltransferase [Dactylosporangium sp. NPDC005555]|uniref:class I SAM-dependent methyltransferase n=1 Tax=Dactylosporangium sp. NPDC005555 TaxID=3154889 RepID=UPI00339E722E